jgi:putative peptidoglycan lipid II flippase
VLLFGYGAFDAESVDMVYWTTAAFTVGLVGHSLLELAARIYYAHKNTIVPFYVALGATVANVGLSLALARPLGGAGLALANSIVVTIQSVILLWLGWQRLVRFELAPVLRLLWRTGIALAAMAGVIWWVIQQQERWSNVVVTALASGLGGLIYIIIAGLLNHRETHALIRVVRARLGITSTSAK